MDVKYHYGEGFQLKVVALCYRDPTFLKYHVDVLNPQWFESLEHQALVYLILVHFAQYKDRPSLESLETSINVYADRYHGVRAEESKLKLLSAFYKCNQANLNDRKAIQDRVLQFGQRQAIKSAVNEIINLIDRDEDFPKARGILDNALKVGVTREPGLDLYETIAQLDELVKDNPLFSPKFKIPTFLPTLNRYLGGGIGVGELGVIAAPPGRGKSTALVNLGIGACFQFTARGARKTVVHISNELKEQDLVLKYTSCLTGVEMNEIIHGDTLYKDIMARRVVVLPKSIRIKYFSPSSIDVADIRGYLSFLEAQEGIEPGLLIIDYADRLEKDAKVEGDYTRMGMIYDALIQLGDDYKIPVWTASQVRRENFKERTVGLDGLSDSWLKNANADIVMTLNQDANEAKMNEKTKTEIIRFYMAKVRRGQDLGEIRCQINKFNATIKEQPHTNYKSVLKAEGMP